MLLRNDWERIKLHVMGDVLMAKFSDPELRGKLLATDQSPLYEGNNWGDRYWGVVNGEGENHLGRLLMAVRLYIQETQT